MVKKPLREVSVEIDGFYVGLLQDRSKALYLPVGGGVVNVPVSVGKGKRKYSIKIDGDPYNLTVLDGSIHLISAKEDPRIALRYEPAKLLERSREYSEYFIDRIDALNYAAEPDNELPATIDGSPSIDAPERPKSYETRRRLSEDVTKGEIGRVVIRRNGGRK
jgi:hypothetical protein